MKMPAATRWLPLALLLTAGNVCAAEDILKPEEAFRYEVSADSQALSVRWTIEPAHYMYRERMSFASQTPGVELGDAVLPPGKPYDDEFFGPMEIYRGTVTAKIPLVAVPAGTEQMDLEIRSQGCAVPVKTTKVGTNLVGSSRLAARRNMWSGKPELRDSAGEPQVGQKPRPTMLPLSAGESQ